MKQTIETKSPWLVAAKVHRGLSCLLLCIFSTAVTSWYLAHQHDMSTTTSNHEGHPRWEIVLRGKREEKCQQESTHGTDKETDVALTETQPNSNTLVHSHPFPLSHVPLKLKPNSQAALATRSPPWKKLQPAPLPQQPDADQPSLDCGRMFCTC